MPTPSNNVHPAGPSPINRDAINRRGALRIFGGALTAAALGRWEVSAAQQDPEATAPAVGASQSRQSAQPIGQIQPLEQAPWWMGSRFPRSRVVTNRLARSLKGSIPDPIVLLDMLARTLQSLTDETSPQRAWRSLLGASQRIVIRFDRMAYSLINTGNSLAQAMIRQLEDAGYAKNSISLVGVPRHIERSFGTQPAERGWSGSLTVAGKPDEHPRWLTESNAIINCGSLIAHPEFGFWSNLTGLGYDVLRHPGRYYRAEYLEEIFRVVGSPAVTARLKLNLTNALRVVLDRGADADADQVASWGGLIASRDPVAADATGFEVLIRERNSVGYATPLNGRLLEIAERLKLGRRQVYALDPIWLGDLSR